MPISDATITDYERAVAAALRDVRVLSDVDQIPLADAAGMNISVYGRIERAERHATIEQLDRIMRAMTRLAAQPTNVQTVTDLLRYAEGSIALTARKDQRGE